MDMKIYRTQEGSETWDSNGNIIACEIKYFVVAPPDKKTGMQAVFEKSPERVWENLTRSAIRFDDYDRDGNMNVSVVYEKNEGGVSGSEEESNATVSFDCGGGTKHLTHSIKQNRVKGSIDAGGAIGWNGKSGSEMQIAGVDVPTAQLRETYTKTMKLSSITTSFKRNVAALVGKVNSGSFKGWNAGEVMFLGMSYSSPDKKSEKVTVTFNFSVQPNESNVRFGDFTVSKKGFEYSWALSETIVENLIPKVNVKAVFIEQVCESANFSALGL